MEHLSAARSRSVIAGIDLTTSRPQSMLTQRYVFRSFESRKALGEYWIGPRHSNDSRDISSAGDAVPVRQLHVDSLRNLGITEPCRLVKCLKNLASLSFNHSLVSILVPSTKLFTPASSRNPCSQLHVIIHRRMVGQLQDDDLAGTIPPNGFLLNCLRVTLTVRLASTARVTFL